MKNLSLYIREVRAELSKVIWPSRVEFTGAVVVVMITLVLASIFLGITNSVFQAGAVRVFQLLSSLY